MSSQFDDEWKTRALAALSEFAPALLAQEARLRQIINDYGRTSQGGEVRAVMRQLREVFDLDEVVDAPALDDVLRSPSSSALPPSLSPAAEAATAAPSAPPVAALSPRRRPSSPPVRPPPALLPVLSAPQQKDTLPPTTNGDGDGYHVDTDDSGTERPTKRQRREGAPAKKQPKTVVDAPVKEPIPEAVRQQASLSKTTTIQTNKNKLSTGMQWRFVCDVKDCDVDRSTPGDFHAHMKKHGRDNGWSIKRSCPPAELYWIAEDDAGKVYSGKIIQIDTKKAEKEAKKKENKEKRKTRDKSKKQN
ncbi:hypothetical protein PV08_01348 [Exophiala spinifera]|uniref:Uncharacterized protein n=1 Tax=Exophiala spinifera TaxID=91928 RepID=A0A0D2BQL5_9EURO|nr:uncharacterized protein PV08_01348 [Exophiala spinifera]KIW20770.1 hypothetical protein PV08_01348 [Exophiala spinifera]